VPQTSNRTKTAQQNKVSETVTTNIYRMIIALVTIGIIYWLITTFTEIDSYVALFGGLTGAIGLFRGPNILRRDVNDPSSVFISVTLGLISGVIFGVFISQIGLKIAGNIGVFVAGITTSIFFILFYGAAITTLVFSPMWIAIGILSSLVGYSIDLIANGSISKCFLSLQNEIIFPILATSVGLIILRLLFLIIIGIYNKIMPRIISGFPITLLGGLIDGTIIGASGWLLTRILGWIFDGILGIIVIGAVGGLIAGAIVSTGNSIRTTYND